MGNESIRICVTCAKPARTGRTECSTCSKKRLTVGKICTSETCDVVVFCKGLCRKHYRQQLAPSTARKCSIPECDRVHYAKDLCASHYKRQQSGATTTGPIGPAPGYPLAWLKNAVEQSRHTNECVLWPFGYLASGYGSVVFNDKRIAANRAAMIIHTNREPKGMQAAHSCRNRGCVSISHLRWATPLANTHDKFLDGTSAMKLTPEQVRAIRADDRSISVIAREFDISLTTVKRIRNGKLWSWLRQ